MPPSSIWSRGFGQACRKHHHFSFDRTFHVDLLLWWVPIGRSPSVIIVPVWLFMSAWTAYNPSINHLITRALLASRISGISFVPRRYCMTLVNFLKLSFYLAPLRGWSGMLQWSEYWVGPVCIGITAWLSCSEKIRWSYLAAGRTLRPLQIGGLQLAWWQTFLSIWVGLLLDVIIHHNF